MADLFTLDSSALPDDVRVVSFRLHEALSVPYEITLHFVTASPDDVDLTDAIAAKAKLSFDRGASGPKMFWHGLIAAIEHVHQSGPEALFKATIVPPVWFLAASEHSRIYLGKSFDEITRSVFDDNGLTSSDYELRLQGSLPKEEHICQYRESDLDFLHRWFEREGLYYYFEHDDDAAKMIIVNQNPSDSLLQAPARYRPSSAGDTSANESFGRFRARRQATPAAVKLRDYDYLKPSLDVKGKADASKTGQVDVARFGERFFTPDDGTRLAKVRAEALLAREEVYEASGNVIGLRPGYQLELDQHPRGAFNKKYLVTKLSHVGIQHAAINADFRALVDVEGSDVYHVDVEAVDAATAYRPKRATPWPRIASEELAVIDGEANSDYAQLDADGRYLVRFMFDENNSDDGHASTRVRMMQPHGGNPEGFHFPLRKGTEVVVTFLAGDPDRPVIAGTVPNAHNPSPITSKNHTRNILITGGRNKIEMEDQDGQQFINIYSPTDNTEIHMGSPKAWKDVGKSKASIQANLGEHTDGTGAFTFGADWRINVGHELEEHVVSSVTEDYDAAVTQTYKGPKIQDVTNQVTEHFHNGHQTTVDNLRSVTVNGHMTETITGGLDQTIGTNMVQTINGPSWRHLNGTAENYAPTYNEHFENYTSSVSTHWTVTSPLTTHSLGAWTLTSGNTGWTMGPMTWQAPSAHLQIPDWTNTSASSWTTGVNAQTAYVFTMANAAIAIAIAGVNIGIYPGANISVTGGINIALKAFYLENKGINLVTGGAKIDCSTIKAFM